MSTRKPSKVQGWFSRARVPAQAVTRPRAGQTPARYEHEELSKVQAAELKGQKGGNCNVTACQRPGAWFRNAGYQLPKGGHAYYCHYCAHDIRRFNNPEEDGFTLFPDWEANLVDHCDWIERGAK